MFFLGFLFENCGDGVDFDNCEEVKWYKRAAENGEVIAMLNPSFTYEKGGDGIAIDKCDQLVHWGSRSGRRGGIERPQPSAMILARYCCHRTRGCYIVVMRR